MGKAVLNGPLVGEAGNDGDVAPDTLDAAGGFSA